MTDLIHAEGTTVTWKGREITGPGRIAIIAGGLLIAWALVLVLTVTWPALLAIHAVLWLAGRRGFVYRDADGQVVMEVPEGALRHRTRKVI